MCDDFVARTPAERFARSALSAIFTLPAANEHDGSPVTAGIIHLMMDSASQRRSFTHPDIRRSSFVRSLDTIRHLHCQRDLMTSLPRQASYVHCRVACRTSRLRSDRQHRASSEYVVLREVSCAMADDTVVISRWCRVLYCGLESRQYTHDQASPNQVPPTLTTSDALRRGRRLSWDTTAARFRGSTRYTMC